MKKFETIWKQLLLWSRSVPAFPRRFTVIAVVLCCFIAAVLRIVTFYAEPVLSSDGIGYVRQAEALRRGQAETGRKILSPHDFYRQYLASRFPGLSPYALGVVTNLILGSLLPLLFFAIAKELFKEDEIAVCGALLAAVQPLLIAYSIEVQREIPYFFFCGCSFLFAVLLLRSWQWYWNAGAAVSAVLTLCFRYEGAELFLFAFIFYALSWCCCRKQRKAVLISAVLFCLFTAAVYLCLLPLLNISPADIWTVCRKRLVR